MKYQCLACKAADNCGLSWKDPTEEYMNCTEFKAPPRTNADRIREMTDEELADEIVKCVLADLFRLNVIGTRPNTKEEWLKWLKEEMKNV